MKEGPKEDYLSSFPHYAGTRYFGTRGKLNVAPKRKRKKSLVPGVRKLEGNEKWKGRGMLTNLSWTFY